jgi:hypothetical protein
MFKHLSVATFLAVATLATAPACAAQTRFYSSQYDYRDFNRYAYDNGYRRGADHGESDAHRGRDFRLTRDDDFRDADRGYRRSYGSIDAYRRIFRQGYSAGYTDAYRRNRRGPGAWYPERTYPGYPIPQAGSYPRSGGYFSVAAQVGFKDGIEVGRDDAHDRRIHDPRRAKRYRDGDHDYDDRYGSRDVYKQEYRAAFERGYDQGFRDFRR